MDKKDTDAMITQISGTINDTKGADDCGYFLTTTGVRIKNEVLHEKTTLLFLAIGIPAHINGYHFLREAVKLAAGNFDMINNITKKLYPVVAKQFSATTSTIEQGIRNAINILWSRGKLANLNSVFGVSVYDNNSKPSNAELIALLAEKLYLDCACTGGMH